MKEKAKKLRNEFGNLEVGIDMDGEQWYLSEYGNIDKQCALIHVNKSITLLETIYKHTKRSMVMEMIVEYKALKQELKNL